MGVWAQDEVVEMLDFTVGGSGGSDYTKSWTYGGWSIYGANNSNGKWGYARFGGGKKAQSGIATMTSPKMIDAVDYVEINHNGKSATAYTISTIVLETSESSDFNLLLSTTTVENPDITKGTPQTLTINIGKQIPANSYYRIKINWSLTSGTSNSGLDVYSVVLKKKASTEPSITASDVTYAADITSGEIPYIINNPVEGTNLTASTAAEWIQNVSVDAAGSKVTFDMSENTEITPRTGTITLAYGDILTKDVTVTQNGAVAKRTVTIETPENGTLKIFRGEEEVVSGSLIPQSTELRAEVTPDEGYKFRNWQAVDATTHTYTTNFTYTVGESDVTFSANFDKIIYHTITWSVNGVETTEQVEEGETITFNDNPAGIPDGYVFTGWYVDEYFNATDAPAYVTSATADVDMTYYAVFAKSNGGGDETATLTANHTTANTAYTSHTYKDDKGGTWTTVSNEQDTGDNARFGLTKNDKNPYFGSPEFPGRITKIEMSVYNGSIKARTFYIDSQETSQSGDLGSIAVAGNEKLVVKAATLEGREFNKFYVHSSDALSFKYIAVTYSSEVFTDFRTSVTAPTTATITIAEACTDGNGMYYGTYSSSKAFVVPGDMEVSEISIIDNKLLVDSYSTGAVVPANTGVMVSSMTAGEHKVTLSEEKGTSVLGEDNMLRPTGDNGVTAAEMAANDADSKYYRLTMHKGVTLGFFWGAAEGAAFDVAANKAYLAVPAAQAAKVAGFAIDGGGTTAIENIEAGNGAEVSRKVYNLQGQRVSGTLPKGLYIIDGRKVIVK